MNKVLYSPLRPDFPHGRSFYQEGAGFGEIKLEAPSNYPSTDLGILTVSFLDIEGAPSVQPRELDLIQISALQDRSFVTTSVHRARCKLATSKNPAELLK